jgi:hypothetical protein
VSSESLARSVSEPKSMRRSLSGFIHTPRPGVVHLAENRMSVTSKHRGEGSNCLTEAPNTSLAEESQRIDSMI